MTVEPVTADGLYPPPRDSRCPFDPPPELLKRLRDEPLSRMRIWDGSEPWLVSRFEDGRTVLADERFSADPTNPGLPEKSAAFGNTLGRDRNIRAIDNPQHGEMKRMIVRDFTAKRAAELRPYIQKLVDDGLDQMEQHGAPVDLVETLAVPIPTRVICELLGVPEDDEGRAFLTARTKTMLDAPTAEEAAAAGEEVNAFIDDIIEHKTKHPGDDLISRLVHEQLLPGNLEHSELLSLSRLLLLGGHETTAAMIAISTLALFQHPDALAELRDTTEAAFIVNAVDELFRYVDVAHAGRRRVAIADVELDGTVIRPGEGVIIMNHVMDRDESVFPDAGRLDLHRGNAKLNVAFGYGIHQCPGRLLARVELQVVHSTMWKRFPQLRLAVPLEELRFVEGSATYSVDRVAVTW